MPYDSDRSSSRIGTIRYRDLKPWLSSEMKENKRNKEKMHDKKFFNPILLALIIGNFLIAVNWMPSWQLDDGMFGDESPSFLINIINFMLLIIVGAYWREKVRWYRSLRDVGLLLFAHLLGWAFLRLFQTVPAGMFDAIIVDGLTLALFNGIFFFMFRILRKLL